MTENGSPPKNSSFRILRPRGFSPLADEVVSTRGHALPALIQSRSSASLRDMRGALRRPSVAKCIDARDEEAHPDRDIGNRDRLLAGSEGGDRDQRRMSAGAQILMTPQMRSYMFGCSECNRRKSCSQQDALPREKYYKSDYELKKLKKPIRKYYERNNFLIQQYIYIDRLLDSSLPHNLIQEYNQPSVDILKTIREEPGPLISTELDSSAKDIDKPAENGYSTKVKVKRTPKALYKLPDEHTRLLDDETSSPNDEPRYQQVEAYGGDDEDVDSGDRIVTVAIYINMTANAILLTGKIAVIVLTSSLSVLASLVDAVLDFLSTGIIWTTTRMIAQRDQYTYPVGRRRLEPIGVLVFSIIMIFAFFQVFMECLNRLTSNDHSIVQIGLPSGVIMASTVVIKFACWLWCRLIKNSSVQALAQDAMTDVVFNTFSIIFPLIGYYAQLWWLDALGGLLLSLYVIVNWSSTSVGHIRNLTGAAASADDRKVLLYLTMRFARSIRQIQGLNAYHAGDKLNVEVDIVLDGNTSLRDSHDLGESLQYVLESVPSVDRAFVHQDYAGWNLPSHMEQQQD
ncbi:MAG: hypothetical protein M1836_004518 [Candelina mexicana]|nr:MAG: hypothetical protein M1836_004518 [Candelina mexicana]